MSNRLQEFQPLRSDFRAVFSVLKFGAIVPPLSPFIGIERVAPLTDFYEPDADNQIIKDGQEAADCLIKQKNIVKDTLDSLLLKNLPTSSDPIVLFSGGVDSSVLACRLKSLGFDGTILINFSFGPDDPESIHAEQMAKEIDLRFVRITAGPTTTRCLEHPGLVYDMPFGDHSVSPTSELAEAVCDVIRDDKRVVLDGVGADGVFGLVKKLRKWRRLTLMPQFIARASSAFYGTGLWQKENNIEYLTRVLSRFLNASFSSSMIAQNPLNGIAYDNQYNHEVDFLLNKWLQRSVGADSVRSALAADVALTCANIFAQKGKPIFERAGHKVFFPYLEDSIVRLCLHDMVSWNMATPKAPLKAILADAVPHDMVYRPKSGFVDPHSGIFYLRPFIEYLNNAVESTSGIGDILNKKFIITASNLLMKGSSLPAQTRNLLWAVVFVDRWYQTFQGAARKGSGAQAMG